MGSCADLSYDVAGCRLRVSYGGRKTVVAKPKLRKRAAKSSTQPVGVASAARPLVAKPVGHKTINVKLKSLKRVAKPSTTSKQCRVDIKAVSGLEPALSSLCTVLPATQPSPVAQTGDRRQTLSHILNVVLPSLRDHAARSTDDEIHLFALLGIGYTLDFDRMMLGVLPDIIRKDPSDRGEFGEMTLSSFERQLRSAIS